MPVRIVKDNPDEMVVNDNFNFENPQDQGQQGGGGIDLSFLNNLLGGGGGGQQGGGGILDLLGGGGRQQGGGILDLLGGGGQSNQGGSSGLLGGLISGFLGGGQQVNRGGSQQQGGGLLSVLGSMAVNACINYAVNSFMNKGGGSKSFSQGAPPSKEDVDGLLNERLASAEICVSLWAHTVFADKKMQSQEKEVIGQLINETVQQLFPSSIANQDEVAQILTDKISNPMDYDDVVDAANQDYNFATQLYQQACLLVAADQALGGAEDDYINNLATDLNLNEDDASAIRQKFGMN
jgi:uncharacterized membrane protein YebE (DUF533 family)